MTKPNLLYKVFKSSWMLDPMTASAAYKVYADMAGAAALKGKYPIIEYEATDDEDETYDNTYYHYRLTHRDHPSIPEGKQISVVRLEGVMMRDEGWCQPGTRDLAGWLSQGDADKRVLATILLVDSGGGAWPSATATCAARPTTHRFTPATSWPPRTATASAASAP